MTFDEKEKRKLNDSLLKKKIVVFLNIESGNIYIGVNVDSRMIQAKLENSGIKTDKLRRRGYEISFSEIR